MHIKTIAAALAVATTLTLSACSGDSDATPEAKPSETASERALPTYGPDTDNDGVEDAEDAFPADPAEWNDLDGNGIGDKADRANELAAEEQAAQEAEAAAHASYDASTATDDEKWEQYQWLLSQTVSDVYTNGVKQKRNAAKISANLCDNSASDMQFFVDASRTLYDKPAEFNDDINEAIAMADAYCPAATPLIKAAVGNSDPQSSEDRVNDTIVQILWEDLSPTQQTDLCDSYLTDEDATRSWISMNLFLKTPGVDAMMRLLGGKC